MLRDFHLGNMERHIRTVHPDEYNCIIEQTKKCCEAIVIEPKRKKIEKMSGSQSTLLQEVTISISFEELKTLIIELITVNGLPLWFVDFPAFQSIISPMLLALKKSSINRHNIIDMIEEESNLFKEFIKREIGSNLVTLKTDIVKKNERSFFGVDLQFCNSKDDMGFQMLLKPYQDALGKSAFSVNRHKVVK